MSNYTWGLLIAGALVLAINAPWLCQLVRHLWRTRQYKNVGHPAFFATRRIR